MTIFGGRPGAVVLVPTQPLLPGSTFTVRADVPAVDPSVRGATLRFGYAYQYLRSGAYECTNGLCDEYEALPPSLRTGSHLHSGRPQWTNGWHEVAAYDLFAGPPAPVSRVVQLTVPPDAPPSTAGLLWWQVRAELDVVHARDPVQPAPLLVVPDPAGEPACLADEPMATDSTVFEVGLDRRLVHRGGTVAGTLTVRPHEAVRTNGLTVRLVREVRQREVSGEVARQETPTVPITGAFDFVPGAPFRVPFQVAVPPDAAACCVTDGFTLHWFLEIVIDKKRWLDSTIRVPVAVV